MCLHCSVASNNFWFWQQVRVLEYDSAHDQLVVKSSWAHPEEIWDIACCPGSADKFATVHSKGDSTRYSVHELLGVPPCQVFNKSV